jgi:hypothetical protein
MFGEWLEDEDTAAYAEGIVDSCREELEDAVSSHEKESAVADMEETLRGLAEDLDGGKKKHRLIPPSILLDFFLSFSHPSCMPLSHMKATKWRT